MKLNLKLLAMIASLGVATAACPVEAGAGRAHTARSAGQVLKNHPNAKKAAKKAHKKHKKHKHKHAAAKKA